jgi:hypothetical protein
MRRLVVAVAALIAASLPDQATGAAGYSARLDGASVENNFCWSGTCDPVMPITASESRILY